MNAAPYEIIKRKKATYYAIGLGLLAIVGRKGVEEVLDLSLSEAELMAFQASARTL